MNAKLRIVARAILRRIEAGESFDAAAGAYPGLDEAEREHVRQFVLGDMA